MPSLSQRHFQTAHACDNLPRQFRISTPDTTLVARQTQRLHRFPLICSGLCQATVSFPTYGLRARCASARLPSAFLLDRRLAILVAFSGVRSPKTRCCANPSALLQAQACPRIHPHVQCTGVEFAKVTCLLLTVPLPRTGGPRINPPRHQETDEAAAHEMHPPEVTPGRLWDSARLRAGVYRILAVWLAPRPSGSERRGGVWWWIKVSCEHPYRDARDMRCGRGGERDRALCTSSDREARRRDPRYAAPLRRCLSLYPHHEA